MAKHQTPNTKHKIRITAFHFAVVLTLLISATGCWTSSQSEVVVYAALDREFSEPILKDFEQQTGIKVLTKYDVESTKTVGLVNAILQERNRPRCDVFWNNEILHILRLQKQGLLAPLEIAGADEFPPQFRAADGQWFGFAARARVLIINTEVIAKDDWPQSVEALADEKWKGKCALAKPLFGTTATHATVLFEKLGDQKAKAFFERVKKNAQVMSGNKQVATAVGLGQLAFGLTDTDDAIIEQDNGRPVQIIFPDQGEDQLGTLFIPNTIAAIQGAKHSQHAQRLIQFVLSSEVEKRLAAGESAQIPLRSDIKERPRVMPTADVRWMEIDYSRAAEKWDAAAQFLRDLFAT